MPITWNLTCHQLIERALQKCSVYGASETLSNADRELARDVINAALKAMHAGGTLWWAVKTDPIAWVGSSMPRPADCVECLYAYWADGRKVRIVERVEYESIKDKTETGDPKLLFDDNGTLNVWPVPDNGTLRLTYQREILDADMTAPLDVPKKLVKPLIDLAAYEISPYFGVSGETMQRITADAARANDMLRALTEPSTEPGVVATEYF